MKLSDLKQPNDLSLQSYVDSLVEAVNKFEDVTVVVLVARPPDQLSMVHNVAHADSVPDVLSQFAAQMRRTPKSFERKEKKENENN